MLQGLNWNAHHIDGYISEATLLVREVSDTLAAIKANVRQMEDILRRLQKGAMFERKDGKVTPALVLPGP